MIGMRGKWLLLLFSSNVDDKAILFRVSRTVCRDSHLRNLDSRGCKLLS